MLRAAVPKAAIDEDRDAALREGNVGADHLFFNADGVVLAEAIAEPMQGGADPDLGLRVSPPDRGHIPRPPRGRDVSPRFMACRRAAAVRLPHNDYGTWRAD